MTQFTHRYVVWGTAAAIFVTSLASLSPAACVAPAAGLVSWWRGEGDALDQAGTNHGTLAGNTAYAVGRVGSGFVLDGSTDLVTVGNPTNLQLQELTIETWIKRSSASTVSSGSFGIGMIFGYGQGGYGLIMLPDGHTGLSLIGTDVASAGPAIADTGFHHVAVTKSGSSVVVYVDGVAYPTPAYNPTFTFSTFAAIGARSDNLDNSFLGTIDEVSVYNRALGANEIQSIYNAGSAGKCLPATCTPAPSGLAGWWSGNGSALDLAGTNNGTFTSPGYAVGEVSQAFSFDASGNNVRIPASSSLDVGLGNGLTIEVWVNPADLTARPIVEWAVNGDYGVHIWANAQNPGYIYASLFGTDGQPHVVESATSVLTTNVYQHVGLTYDKVSGIGRLFLNGAMIREVAVGTFTPRTSSDLYVGYRPPGSPFGPVPFLGKIDEVSVYNRALSANEIQSIYYAAGEGKCPPEVSINLVANGGLETLPGDTFKTVLSGSTYANWSSIGGGDVEFVTELTAVPGGFFGPAAEGSGCVDLNGIAYQGAISQSITNASGGLYLVRFAMSGNPGLLGQQTLGDKTMSVFWGGANIGSFVFQHLPGDTQTTLRWEYHQVLVTGSGLDDLEFRSTTGTYNDAGPVIDDVSVVRILNPFLSITSQPNSQNVTIGETATFKVIVFGNAPLNYQWRLNTTNIVGATTDTLVLTDVQLTNAGLYSVIISNLSGSMTSSNALLTVNTLAACVNPPAGLVGWWRGENNALDQVGANNGTLVGNPALGVGRVSQGFVLDGFGAGVALGNPASLQLQDFTIEAWIKRASVSIASHGFNGGEIFAYGYGGYALGMLDNGTPFLTRVGIDNVMPNTAISDTNFHHLVVTKLGTNTVFYVDGVAFLVPSYNTTYTFGTPVAIGVRGDTLANSFLGTIDEVSVYNRPLTAGEVQAIYNAGSSGKCLVAIPPSITTQPQTQTAQIGSTATLNVVASGTPTLAYQWTYNGTNISGANSDSLTLTNLAFNQAGNYAVVVTNVAGSVASSNAVLSVVFPPAAVRLTGATGPAGGVVTVPVVLVANGNENALGFSLSFNPSLLSYTNISLGSGATGATLLLNTNLAPVGKLGVALALPANAVFPAGTQEMVRVDLRLGVVLNTTAVSITFGDTPIVRELSDASGNPLAATFSGANVLIAGAQFEGDLSPRPNGDKSLSVTDWVLAGRYLARLDYPTNAAEFQRADCAPRNTLGDGLITVTDWVQAGRYAAKLDPATPLGGPSEETPAPNVQLGGPRPAGVKPLVSGRQLVVADAMVLQGQAGSTKIRLEAQGNENALGFSLSFDPAVMSYTSAALAAGTPGAVFLVNTNQVALGRLGFALSLPTGSQFAAGTQEVVTVNFQATAGVAGSYPVALTQTPVPCGVSDANALALTTSYVNGTLTINPPPTLKIGRVGTNVVLSWPLWSSNFVLEQSGNGLPPTGTWTNLPVNIGVSNNESSVTLPLDDAVRYFRLHLP